MKDRNELGKLVVGCWLLLAGRPILAEADGGRQDEMDAFAGWLEVAGGKLVVGCWLLLAGRPKPGGGRLEEMDGPGV